MFTSTHIIIGITAALIIGLSKTAIPGGGLLATPLRRCLRRHLVRSPRTPRPSPTDCSDRTPRVRRWGTLLCGLGVSRTGTRYRHRKHHPAASHSTKRTYYSGYTPKTRYSANHASGGRNWRLHHVRVKCRGSDHEHLPHGHRTPQGRDGRNEFLVLLWRELPQSSGVLSNRMVCVRWSLLHRHHPSIRCPSSSRCSCGPLQRTVAAPAYRPTDLQYRRTGTRRDWCNKASRRRVNFALDRRSTLKGPLTIESRRRLPTRYPRRPEALKQW
jgi:hypothetical protein